jgi:hypothetical protein
MCKNILSTAGFFLGLIGGVWSVLYIFYTGLFFETQHEDIKKFFIRIFLIENKTGTF